MERRALPEMYTMECTCHYMETAKCVEILRLIQQKAEAMSQLVKYLRYKLECFS